MISPHNLNFYTKSHRHYVAAPLFALIILGAVGYGGESVDSATFIVEAEDHEEWSSFALANGIRGVVYEGGQLEAEEDQLTLLAGSALFASEGLIELNVPGAHLYGYSGGFHVSVIGEKVIVVSVTSPVLVVQDSKRMIVPMGYQWTLNGALPTMDAGLELWVGARSPQSVPSRFMRTQLEHLVRLPAGEDLLPPTVATPPGAFHESVLLLDAADARRKVDWIEEVLGSLRYYIENDMEEQAHILLLNVAYADALNSERGTEVIGMLLSMLSQDSKLLAPLVSGLVQQEHYWLLASVHESFRKEAWTQPRPVGVTRESRAIRIFMLPQSDTGREAIALFTMKRWESAVGDIADSFEDPTLFLAELIQLIAPRVAEQEEQGYPMRARRLAAALLAISEPYKVDLPGSTLSALEQLTLLDTVDLGVEYVEEEEVTQEEEVIQEEEQVLEFNEEDVESAAYAFLQDMGAMFTLETKLTAQSPIRVDVQGIIFPAKSGDVAFNFTLDLHQEELQDIQMAGETFPYDLSPEAFLTWLRK